MACVYGLKRNVDPTIRYVGISKNDTPDRRFKIHKRAARHGVLYPVYDWMRKYDDVVFVLIKSELTWEEACKYEINLISKLRKNSNSRLLNISDGGQGPTGYLHSKESLAKLSNALKGRTLSEEHRINISKGQTGKTKSKEHRKNIARARIGKEGYNKGKKMSEEQRKRVSEGLKRSWKKRNELKNS
jgi:hypothetical protein